MNLEQFLHEKLLKNDVFKENLVKFGNHVETKLLYWSQCFEILHEKTIGYLLLDDIKQNFAM